MMRWFAFIGVLVGFWVAAASLVRAESDPASQSPGKQPVTVNGDTVEFLADGREVVASGHVEIVYKEATLRCDSVRVFIDEKLALAEGNVSFSQPGAQELKGETIIYDFGTQSGTVIEPEVKFPPYYGGARLMEKISATEYLLERAEVSTCDLPHPHYNLTCREIKMNPKGMMSDVCAKNDR
jgi:lipopolysaccharide assembly outer membrane protein LptD (OstA)